MRTAAITAFLMTPMAAICIQASATFIPGRCVPVDSTKNLSIDINNVTDTFPLVLHMDGFDVELFEQDDYSTFRSADSALIFRLKNPSSSFCDGGVLSGASYKNVDMSCEIAIGCHHR